MPVTDGGQSEFLLPPLSTTWTWLSVSIVQFYSYRVDDIAATNINYEDCVLFHGRCAAEYSNAIYANSCSVTSSTSLTR